MDSVIRQHPMCFTTANTHQTGLVLQTREISTAGLQTQPRIYLKKGSQLWREEARRWHWHQVRRRSAKQYNTFGTPYLIRPIEYGADIVVHSATKFIGGHGTTLGGIIVEAGKYNWKESGKFPNIADPNPSYHGVSFYEAVGSAAFVTYIRAILLRDTGATISPFNAFLLLQGVETLSLRIERHVENTKKVVDYLKKHPLVEKVNHPSIEDHPDHALYEKYFPNGGASIFTFEIKGSRDEAWKFIDHLKIFSLFANVADVKSLVIHPASTTHSQLSEEELLDQGIRQNTIRLSIGTEHIDDIIADLEKGFEAIG